MAVHVNPPSGMVEAMPSRRDFVYGLGATLGTVALNAMLQADPPAPISAEDHGPLTPRKTHHEPRARRCIFLFMEGGPSHIDTFDPKPKLHDLHLTKFKRQDKFASAMASGNRYFVESPFRFMRAGKSGIELCEHFRHLTDVESNFNISSLDYLYACLRTQTISQRTISEM